MGQGDTSSESATVQRQFVTRPLRDRQRVGGLTQGGRIGQQRPSGNRERVREVHHTGQGGRVGPTRPRGRLREVVPPAGNAQAPSGRAAKSDRPRQGGSDDQV